MSKLVATVIVGLFVSVFASAQAEPPFYGTWSVTWEGKKQLYEAKLVLAAQGGTWQTSTREKNNPCVGREVPVKVSSVSAEEAQLTLAFSEAIPGCQDSKVILRAGPGGVTGARGTAKLNLKRE